MYTEPTFERKTSTAIAHKINAKMKECWSNSIQAMRYLPPDAVYVEGWAVAHQNQIIEHGWCQVNSRIIDVTLLTEPGVIVYFPGILYTHNKLIELLSQLREDEKLPFILNSEKYELNGTIYRFAYEAANKYILACQKERNKQYCTASQLPVELCYG